MNENIKQTCVQKTKHVILGKTIRGSPEPNFGGITNSMSPGRKSTESDTPSAYQQLDINNTLTYKTTTS